MESGVGAYVVDGLRKERVKTILDTAVSHFNTFNRLRDELERANQQLEERKVIERAKGILMKERGLSESRRLRAAAHGGDEREPAHRRRGAQRRLRGAAVEVSSTVTRPKITVGFIPLLDCARHRGGGGEGLRRRGRPRRARWCARRRGRTFATG